MTDDPGNEWPYTTKDYDRAHGSQTQDFRDSHHMEEGTQAQHNLKRQYVEKLGLDPDRMGRNMESLQSRDLPAENWLTTKGSGEQGGTTYTIHQDVAPGEGTAWVTPTTPTDVRAELPPVKEVGGTYGNEHKFADRYMIREELKRFENDDPRIPRNRNPDVPPGEAYHLDELTKEQVRALSLTKEQREHWLDLAESAGASSRFKIEGGIRDDVTPGVAEIRNVPTPINPEAATRQAEIDKAQVGSGPGHPYSGPEAPPEDTPSFQGLPGARPAGQDQSGHGDLPAGSLAPDVQHPTESPTELAAKTAETKPAVPGPGAKANIASAGLGFGDAANASASAASLSLGITNSPLNASASVASLSVGNNDGGLTADASAATIRVGNNDVEASAGASAASIRVGPTKGNLSASLAAGTVDVGPNESFRQLHVSLPAGASDADHRGGSAVSSSVSADKMPAETATDGRVGQVLKGRVEVNVYNEYDGPTPQVINATQDGGQTGGAGTTPAAPDINQVDNSQTLPRPTLPGDNTETRQGPAPRSEPEPKLEPVFAKPSPQPAPPAEPEPKLEPVFAKPSPQPAPPAEPEPKLEPVLTEPKLEPVLTEPPLPPPTPPAAPVVPTAHLAGR